MPEVAFIKYKNRRLYDVKEHRYVSTTQARDKLLKGGLVHNLQDEDVTAEVLVRVLSLDQKKGKRGLTADKLRAFICSYLT